MFRLRVGRAQPRLAEVDIEIIILPLLSLSGTIALPGTATRSADNPTGAMLVDVRVRVRFAWNVRAWCRWHACCTRELRARPP